MSQIDNEINQLFAVLEQQRVAVQKAEKEIKRSWLTTCHYETILGKSIALQVLKTEDDVIKVMSDLVYQHTNIQTAATELGIEKKILINGFSYEDWKHDLQKRLAQLQIQGQKDKLSKLEKRLEGVESPEQKRQKEINALKKELGV